MTEMPYDTTDAYDAGLGYDGEIPDVPAGALATDAPVGSAAVGDGLVWSASEADGPLWSASVEDE